MDLDLEALAVNSRDLQGEGFMEPEAQARDGGAGDLMVEGRSRRKDTSACCTTEASGEMVGGVRAHTWAAGAILMS